MHPVERIRQQVREGDTSAAIATADALVHARDIPTAAAAYWTIAETDPQRGGQCFGIAADLYAELGNIAAAHQAYNAAASHGAPPQWVAHRVERLQSLVHDAFCTSSSRESSFGGHQPGTIVIRPAYVAYIPTGSNTSLAQIAGKVAVGFAVQTIRFGGMSPEQAGVHLGAQLSLVPAEQLDAIAPAMARDAGGVVWTPNDAAHFEKKLPLGVRLYFAAGRDRVHVGFPKKALMDPRFVRLRTHFWAPRAD